MKTIVRIKNMILIVLMLVLCNSYTVSAEYNGKEKLDDIGRALIYSKGFDDSKLVFIYFLIIVSYVIHCLLF